MKQMSENSNKMKRETWLNQKTKKIKEQTVKSLEQESFAFNYSFVCTSKIFDLIPGFLTK